MKPGTNYESERYKPMKQGDIVLVPFPFTDLSGMKKRPVLVISNNRYNISNRDFVCCGITSKINDRDYSVAIDTNDLADGFLAQPSMVKADTIFTLEQSLVIKTIGRASQQTIEKVKGEFLKLL